MINVEIRDTLVELLACMEKEKALDPNYFIYSICEYLSFEKFLNKPKETKQTIIRFLYEAINGNICGFSCVYWWRLTTEGFEERLNCVRLGIGKVKQLINEGK